jgi:ATP-dependent RNA helicase RhlE
MESRSTSLIFEELNLNQRVLAGVKAAGYTNPTPIQEQAIPIILEGRDVLGLAQTGTGKTAGFMLPILQRLTAGPLGQVRALIVSPTRELAEQTYQTAVDLGRNTRIRSVAIYGGVSKGPQVKALNRPAEIVVACPGRLLDHLNDGSIDLSTVEVLVLDEADTMCDMGFLPDIRRILTHLPKRRQTLFFAATMPDEIRVLSNDILNDPTTVQVDIIAPAKTVSHALYPATDSLKKRLLLGLLQHTATGRVMVFTRTKHRARRLAADLENARYRVAALQGNMAQNRRQQAINGFRDGKYDVLVATDVASRGIDVADVSHVINFDMPNTVDAYIHRIGRTGRAEQSGEAFTLTMPEDEVLVRRIEAVLGARIERRRLPNFDYGSFNPEFQTPKSRPNSQRGQRPDGRPVAKSTQLRPDNRSAPNGARRRYPRHRSPAPATYPAR